VQTSTYIPGKVVENSIGVVIGYPEAFSTVPNSVLVP